MASCNPVPWLPWCVGFAPDAVAEASTSQDGSSRSPPARQKRVVGLLPQASAVRRSRLPAPPARPSASSPACTPPQDQLDLKSSVALVIDQDTREVLFSKNDSAVLPIASLTKLMTGAARQRGQAADGRDDHHHPGRRRHRKGQQFAPAGRHDADAAANCCTWR